MKKLSLFICLCVLSLLLSITALCAVNRVTMYAPDGRTIIIAESSVEEYQKVGWFTEPPVQLYAADGRTKYVNASRVPAEEAVGWYSDKSAVTKKMFALDGRSKTVFNAKVAAEQSVGWYLLDDYTEVLFETGGFEKVCERLDMHYAQDNDEIFLTKKAEILNEWFIKEQVPVVITHSEIAHDSNGVPVAVISFRNIGKASVESFECTFSCHDLYGNITSDSPEFNGLASVSASVSLASGESYTGLWKLVDNTKTVKTGKIFITKIVLSDGTVFTA